MSVEVDVEVVKLRRAARWELVGSGALVGLCTGMTLAIAALAIAILVPTAGLGGLWAILIAPLVGVICGFWDAYLWFHPSTAFIKADATGIYVSYRLKVYTGCEWLAAVKAGTTVEAGMIAGAISMLIGYRNPAALGTWIGFVLAGALFGWLCGRSFKKSRL